MDDDPCLWGVNLAFITLYLWFRMMDVFALRMWSTWLSVLVDGFVWSGLLQAATPLGFWPLPELMSSSFYYYLAALWRSWLGVYADNIKDDEAVCSGRVLSAALLFRRGIGCFFLHVLIFSFGSPIVMEPSLMDIQMIVCSSVLIFGNTFRFVDLWFMSVDRFRWGLFHRLSTTSTVVLSSTVSCDRAHRFFLLPHFLGRKMGSTNLHGCVKLIIRRI